MTLPDSRTWNKKENKQTTTKQTKPQTQTEKQKNKPKNNPKKPQKFYETAESLAKIHGRKTVIQKQSVQDFRVSKGFP